MSQRRLTAYFFLLLTSIIWGVAGPVIKYTLFFFPPLIFLTYRFALSSMVGLLFFSNTQRIPKIKKTSIVLLVVLCAFLTSTVRLGTLFFGLDETTSMAGTLITALTPVFMALAGHFALKERVTRVERLGMAIAIVGTLFSVLEPVLATESGIIKATLRGNGIVFFSLLVDVLAVLLTKIVVKKAITPSALSHITFIVGFITIVPIALYIHTTTDIMQTILTAPLSAHLGVLYMAFLSGTLAYYLNGKGLKSIELGEAGIFTYLTPIWAAPFSLLWLGEQITGPFLFGAFLIFVGVGIAEYKRRVG